MNSVTGFRIFICIFILSIFLYRYIDQQNGLTRLRLRLPTLAKEIKAIKEENQHLQYQIDQFENPEHLMALARNPAYAHLKQPLTKEIFTCIEGLALEFVIPEETGSFTYTSKPTLAVGAAH